MRSFSVMTQRKYTKENEEQINQLQVRQLRLDDEGRCMIVKEDFQTVSKVVSVGAENIGYHVKEKRIEVVRRGDGFHVTISLVLTR